jgi:subtilase family serine protease
MFDKVNEPRIRRTSVAVSALLGAAVIGFAGAGPAQAAPDAAPAAAGQAVDFEVFLPLRNTKSLDALLKAQQTKGSSSYHQWLTPAQFRTQFGASDAVVARVSKALQAQGLTVTDVHSQSLHVTGTVGAVNRFFGATLQSVKGAHGGTRLVAGKNLVMPAALKAEGAVVAAFNGRPEYRTHATRTPTPVPENRYSSSGFYWFDDLKQAYDYPSYQSLDGTGVHVAVVMSSDVLDSDVQAAFNHEKFTAITGNPVPTVHRFNVFGGAPFDPNSGASFEASLDVQQVLGGAPGANLTLVNIPDLSDTSVLAAYIDVDEFNAWDIVSSSFGGCELFYSAPYNGGQDFSGILDVFEALFKQGNAQGITFLASSGDQGGLGCPDPSYFSGPSATPVFLVGVENPASSPHVTAVGGGNLITTQPSPGSLTSNYVHENSYGDPEVPYDPYGVGVNVSGGYWGAGGGVSRHFLAPWEQALVPTGRQMRSVPDIGMQVGGCPFGISTLPCGPGRSAAIVAFAGSYYGVIGTSVSSPEFAGALALAEQYYGGRAGDLNPYLYFTAALQNALPPGPNMPYHRMIPGYDGKYVSGGTRMYDFIQGNGTVDVRQLFGLTGLPAAGDPQTASNP